MMDSAGTSEGRTSVRSALPVRAAPPPDTVTWFVTCDGALTPTLTVTAIGGRALPPAHESFRAQVVPEQVQAGPAMETSVRYGGRISVTVMDPLGGPLEAACVTVTV